MQIALTTEYYKGDRADRESGFDVTFRFGPYSGRTHHFAPVCLNALLYKSETDLEWMASELHLAGDAQSWRAKAAERRANIDRYLWSAARHGYFDRDLDSRAQSDYVFATAFYPLWAGAASQQQAQEVRNAMLPLLERAGGIATSTQETGVQWDLPYGWAPLQMLAVEGLARYGFREDALRLARKWNSMIDENLARDGTIREKYNVVTRSSETHVTAGYAANNAGFGWTNGTYLVLSELLRNAR